MTQRISLFLCSDAKDVKVAWSKNGEALKKGKKLKMTVEGNILVVIISKATAEDAGDYLVVISNDAGSVETKIHADVEKEEKKKKKKELKVGVKTEVEAEKVEEGEVKVEVSTTEEQETVKKEKMKVEMKQTVEEKPAFEETPESSNVKVGGTIKLQCKVAGM
jgi:hypothetical protein